MKPLLYIHIGFPKTGTSTIQKFCYENRDLLKEQGLYYPQPHAIFPGHDGHLDISEKTVTFFQGNIAYRECVDLYIKDILQEKCKMNLLSSEALIIDKPSTIKELFDRFDIRIVCFIRNIFDFMSSHEKQVVKDGLRHDLFSTFRYRNHWISHYLERYRDCFGEDKCIFLNYDKVNKEKNILKTFFSALNVNIDLKKHTIRNENVTPPDAAMMFFYQLSFLPFTRSEWSTLQYEIFNMDFSKWKTFRCTLLPSFVFSLGEAAKRAIRFQAELLNDTGWYDYTLSRRDALAAIGNHDLQPEIQHDIWEKLTDKARSIILQHWPNAGKAKSCDSLLPSLEKVAPDIFDQLLVLRRGYVTCSENISRMREKEQANEVLQTEFQEEKLRKQSRILQMRKFIVKQKRGKYIWQCFGECFSALFLSSARQSCVIRRSGLFDIGWYLEQYPDVSERCIDPVLHYVRYGAREGRDPAPWFSTVSYLRSYPDVAKSGLNPFYHYIYYGIFEKR